MKEVPQLGQSLPLGDVITGEFYIFPHVFPHVNVHFYAEHAGPWGGELERGQVSLKVTRATLLPATPPLLCPGLWVWPAFRFSPGTSAGLGPAPSASQ